MCANGMKEKVEKGSTLQVQGQQLGFQEGTNLYMLKRDRLYKLDYLSILRLLSPLRLDDLGFLSFPHDSWNSLLSKIKKKKMTLTTVENFPQKKK